MEIAIVTSGRGMHLYDEQAYPIRAGDVFVIHPQVAHSYQTQQDLVIANVLFIPELGIPLLDELRADAGYRSLFVLEPRLRRKRSYPNRLHLAPAALFEVESILQRLDHALHGTATKREAMATVHFLHLVSTLCQMYGEVPSTSAQALMHVSRAIRFVEERFREDMCVETLADVSHMSQRNFHRTFRDATGTTPAQYVTEMRIREACRLLTESGKSITEIAYDVGFRDSNYFTRAFRKVMGTPPARFRHRMSAPNASRLE